jgi:Zn-dependent alcohol dehydrogenase
MRAAGIRALGEPVEILEVDELAPPGADEVLIDVAAAGIGNWDELVRIGSWRIGGPAPMALGTEAAGRSQQPAPAWPRWARAMR